MFGAFEKEGSRAVADTLTGRWPANLIHDGSAEVLAVFPLAGGGNPQGVKVNAVTSCGTPTTRNVFGGFTESQTVGYGDTGSAARFFYEAKASKADRDEGLHGFEDRPAAAMVGNMVAGQRLAGDGSPIATPLRANHHPTVKPTDLMRYLCRLVTPAGGIVLDPFMGSGSTGKGAVLEGLQFIGIEREAEYLAIAQARINHAHKLHLSGAQFLKPASERDAHTVDLFSAA